MTIVDFYNLVRGMIIYMSDQKPVFTVLNPFNSNLPLSSVMVKLMSEESFFCMRVIVPLTTGCFATESKAIPLIIPFFCARAIVQKKKTGTKKIRLIAVELQLRKYS
jgi:hypothetical protein